MATIPSATGPLDTAELGFTYMHEHVIVGTPGLYQSYPELWQPEKFMDQAVQRLREARERGVRTMVDLTPADFHRDARFVQAAARRSGMQLILATGIYWRSTPFFDGHPIEELVPLLVKDITEGIQGSGIRAAILKAATDEPGVTPQNEKALRAVARAHRQTGVPISTHTNARLEMGTKQQDVFESEGVDLSRVVIGHSGDTEDLDYLKRLMARGSYIGMDRFGLDRLLPFEKRVATVAALCKEGFAGRIVLSHDASCLFDWAPEERLREFAPNWHFRHIVDDVLPALHAQGVSQAQIDQMTTGNPRAIFEKQGGY
ncbi:MAG TPA: phosphotriesterase-related protein [Dehalococcoidia bacterium]|nr:phosphotriesterase-related protein [Dehalococcoidia bacterium]